MQNGRGGGNATQYDLEKERLTALGCAEGMRAMTT